MRLPARKSVIQIALLLAAFIFLFGHAIKEMVHDWSINDNYSHGFLVPLIAAYMIWQKKHQLSKIGAKPDGAGLLVILIGMCVFIVGNIGAELFITRTAIIITIVGLCIYSFGLRIATAVAVPLSYLMFMIPLPVIIWNKIAFPLQFFAARCTTLIVHCIGIPLLREGNVLYLSNTTLEVVDACSGLRSLTSLLALSAAFAYIVKLSRLNKWLLFLAAVPIAVIVNIVRLTATVLLAKYVGPETAHGFLHDLSGIIVFFLAIIIFYTMYAAMNKIERFNGKSFPGDC